MEEEKRNWSIRRKKAMLMRLPDFMRKSIRICTGLRFAW